jgi:histone H3/H4
MDNNGWSGKPGVPLNPERWRGAINDALTNWLSPIEDHETPKDALQRLIRLEVMAALDPKVSQSAADLVAAAHKEWLAELNHDTDALMEEARRDALEEAARRLEELHRRHKYNPETGEGSEHDTGYYRALCEGAGWIRALSDTPPGMVLVPREPTPAMIQACLQAALDFMAETKTTEIHPGQTYPSPSENARRCWRAMVKAAGKGEGDE